MDRDGTRDGFDLALTRAVVDAVDIPVVASGGVGRLQDLVDGAVDGGADAVLAASIFHRREFTIGEAKAYMAANGGVAGRSGPGGGRPAPDLGGGFVRYRARVPTSTTKNGTSTAEAQKDTAEEKQPISVLFDRVMVQISPERRRAALPGRDPDPGHGADQPPPDVGRGRGSRAARAHGEGRRHRPVQPRGPLRGGGARRGVRDPARARHPRHRLEAQRQRHGALP